MRRLDIGRETDRHLIEQKTKEGNPFAALSSAQYNLVYFYASYFDRGNFWFLEKEELLAVVEEAEDHLRIKEILGDTDRPLTEIVDHLADRCGRRIVLGFTPKDTGEWTSVPLHEADSNLFLFKEKENPFLHHRLKFPDLSHA